MAKLEPSMTISDAASIPGSHLIKLRTTSGHVYAVTFQNGGHGYAALEDGSIPYADGDVIDLGNAYRVEIDPGNLVLIDVMDRPSPGDVFLCGDSVYLTLKSREGEQDLPTYVDLIRGIRETIVNGRKAIAKRWSITLSDGRIEVLKK